MLLRLQAHERRGGAHAHQRRRGLARTALLWGRAARSEASPTATGGPRCQRSCLTRNADDNEWTTGGMGHEDDAGCAASLFVGAPPQGYARALLVLYLNIKSLWILGKF